MRDFWPAFPPAAREQMSAPIDTRIAMASEGAVEGSQSTKIASFVVDHRCVVQSIPQNTDTPTLDACTALELTEQESGGGAIHTAGFTRLRTHSRRLSHVTGMFLPPGLSSTSRSSRDKAVKFSMTMSENIARVTPARFLSFGASGMAAGHINKENGEAPPSPCWGKIATGNGYKVQYSITYVTARGRE